MCDPRPRIFAALRTVSAGQRQWDLCCIAYGAVSDVLAARWPPVWTLTVVGTHMQNFRCPTRVCDFLGCQYFVAIGHNETFMYAYTWQWWHLSLLLFSVVSDFLNTRSSSLQTYTPFAITPPGNLAVNICSQYVKSVVPQWIIIGKLLQYVR